MRRWGTDVERTLIGRLSLRRTSIAARPLPHGCAFEVAPLQKVVVSHRRMNRRVGAILAHEHLTVQ
jgi:hypothetical protein